MERPSLWLGFALQILVVRWSGCQADVDLTCEYGAALCIDHDFAYMVSNRQMSSSSRQVHLSKPKPISKSECSVCSAKGAA